jgi:hypothetical protein
MVERGDDDQPVEEERRDVAVDLAGRIGHDREIAAVGQGGGRLADSRRGW